MTFIEKMKQKSKQDIKTIVLPEAEDLRVLKASEKIIKEGFAKIILVGDPEKIDEKAKENNINLEGAKVINPLTSEKLSKYSNDLYELRKNKGMTLCL